MNEILKKKIGFSIKLLRSIPAKNGPVEIAYSGGKDSDVILELAKIAGIDFQVIYKNTTIDPPGTIQHALDNNAQIISPKRSFFSMVESKGFPSRFSRFCCSELKEYAILPQAVVGIRRCESTKRAMIYKEPELCRVYGGKKVRQYLPILEWTNDEVAEFISERNIKLAPTYYDTNAKFHVERRLGCMGCPLSSKRIRIATYKKYPNFLLRSIAAMQIHYNNKTLPSRTQRICNNDAWNFFYVNLFCESIQDYDEKAHNSLFPEMMNSREFMIETFKLQENSIKAFDEFIMRHTR